MGRGSVQLAHGELSRYCLSGLLLAPRQECELRSQISPHSGLQQGHSRLGSLALLGQFLSPVLIKANLLSLLSSPLLPTFPIRGFRGKQRGQCTTCPEKDISCRVSDFLETKKPNLDGCVLASLWT